MNIKTEIERRESLFVTRLKALGQAELASLYSDIITLRDADEVLNKTLPTNGSGKSAITVADTNDDDFVLRTAVREQIKAFGSREFTTREMFQALAAKHPNDVNADRMASVSATLANLVGKELTKKRDERGRMSFRAVEH